MSYRPEIYIRVNNLCSLGAQGKFPAYPNCCRFGRKAMIAFPCPLRWEKTRPQFGVKELIW
jgi:hypothetical protein